MNNNFNILIVGNGAIVSTIARVLRKNKNIDKIFATCHCNKNELFQSIDIREDNVEELLKFVLDNEINLTIATGEKSLKADIAGFFQTNGQNIFAPTKDACRIALDNIFCKKFLYRIHAQTSKFNILEKAKTNYELLHSLNFPITIRNNSENCICTTFKQARELISQIFNNTNEQNLLVEDFAGDKIFTMYFISDGYSILPITSARNCFNNDLSAEIGAFAPDYRISQVVFERICNIAQNIIDILVNKNMPYIGILGINCTLTTKNQFVVNQIKPFFSESSASAVLNLLENDFFELIWACVNGFFADEYEQINTSDKISASIKLFATKKFEQLEDENETIDKNYENNSLVLTQTANTAGFVKEKLRNSIEDYNLKVPENFFTTNTNDL